MPGRPGRGVTTRLEADGRLSRRPAATAARGDSRRRPRRNTDGIDPGNSTNVTISHSYIHTGDDHVAIKAPRGTAATHMSILHDHFYAGHGMSIGSTAEAGASAIRVSDLSIDGADNGLRIKSNVTRGGMVHHVVYEDVCIRGRQRRQNEGDSHHAEVKLGPAGDDVTVSGAGGKSTANACTGKFVPFPLR